MKRFLVILMLLVLAGFVSAWANPTAKQVMEQVRKNLEACDQHIYVRLVMDNGHGIQTERTLEILDACRPKDNLTYVRFLSPRQVKDVQLLSLGDKQWFKLPSVKARRIATSDKGNSFMQTEFFFEDLESWRVDDYSYTMVKDDDGLLIIDAAPKKESVYSKLRLYIESAKRAVTQTEYYDKQGRLWKEETKTRYVNVGHGSWRPDEIRMVNKLTGRETTAHIERRTVDPIPANKFSPSLIE